MRRAVYAKDVHLHKNPIPHASILKGFMVSSAISGANQSTGLFSNSKKEQIFLAFENMRILEEANAGFEELIKLDLYFANKDGRKYVNPIWLKFFPNINSRPARYSHLAKLEAGCIFQIVFTAIL